MSDEQVILIKKDRIKKLRESISQMKNQIIEQEQILEDLLYENGLLENEDNIEEEQ